MKPRGRPPTFLKMSRASPGAADGAGAAGDGDDLRRRRGTLRREVGEVGAEGVEELAGDEALEAADDFRLGFAFRRGAGGRRRGCGGSSAGGTPRSCGGRGLALRSPPWLRRKWPRRPEDNGLGLERWLRSPVARSGRAACRAGADGRACGGSFACGRECRGRSTASVLRRERSRGVAARAAVSPHRASGPLVGPPGRAPGVAPSRDPRGGGDLALHIDDRASKQWWSATCAT